MYDAYPEAINIPQHSDNVRPIHLAAAQNETPEIFKFIISVSPDAPYVQDNEHWLPLHCLIYKDKSTMTKGRLECLRILLKPNSKGVAIKNSSCNTPIDMAREMSHGKLIMRLLLNCDPTQGLTEYYDYNWLARKEALLIYYHVIKSKDLIDKLSIVSLNSLFGFQEQAFIKLCHAFGTPNENSITNEILRHIITFL